MKRISTLCTLIVSGCLCASAQTYPLFNSTENIDIGNIKAAHLVHGDMWWDPASGSPRCEYPKGSGKHVGFTSSLWMGGMDGQNILKFAAQKYRTGGATDYWPGPIDTGVLTSVSYATSTNWAKIWKINRSQLDSFLKLAAHTAANTPAAIMEWPAKGNPYAKGANGVTLSIPQPMAPFVDVNSDGIYNPLTGDYPAIKGDQMLWWIINDYGPTLHDISRGGRLGIDIKISAYAYHRNAVSDNIIFYEYQIKNHSSLSYNNFRMAIMADLDLGNAFDDYTGFDSTHRMGIAYNGSRSDGSGRTGEYGPNPPVSGIAVVEMPGDAYNMYVPTGSYVAVNNSTGPDGDPMDGAEMYKTMNSSNRVGTPLPNGMLYQYNIDSECVNAHVAGDRRFVIATKDMFLDASASKKIGFALIVASAGGCPEFNPTSLYMAADTAFKYYWNPPPAPSVSTGIAGVNASYQLRVFPNPAKDLLYVEPGKTMQGSLSIYNTVGQLCTPPLHYAGNRIEIELKELPPGAYTVHYKDENGVGSSIFIKE